jgi:hypothetical protein
MNIPLRKIDLIDVINQSYIANEWVERQRRCVNDVYKTERVITQECQSCFYSQRIGGQAITRSYCGICEKEMTFGNTNVDAVCLECAKEHRLCKHCAGDINMKRRNKL